MSKNKTIRVKYEKAYAVDGDTIDIILKSGPIWNRNKRIRVYGIDTHEMRDKKSENRAKAVKAKWVLNNQLTRWFKARLYIKVYKGKHGNLKPKTDKYGRILATVKVFKWRGYINYSKLIKEKGLEKKGSKWNL